MGFTGGKALVEQVVREGGVPGKEFGGEGFSFRCLRTWGAVGVQGKAHDEGVHLMFSNEAADGFEVGVEAGAMEGEEGLGGEAETVGDGKTDATVSHVKSHDAADGHGGSVGGWAC